MGVPGGSALAYAREIKLEVARAPLLEASSCGELAMVAVPPAAWPEATKQEMTSLGYWSGVTLNYAADGM